ncbi:hypothetical protein E2C01_011426 [Portunus trituberculatus]|uniref:Uncharacterized protein n=1 Tax=Portunus trituberculatus TaxID=210409 RepID=A0A5B7DBD5_PORTR|nr:hypothetical protein [Portunus trituberculatus]
MSVRDRSVEAKTGRVDGEAARHFPPRRQYYARREEEEEEEEEEVWREGGSEGGKAPRHSPSMGSEEEVMRGVSLLRTSDTLNELWRDANL